MTEDDARKVPDPTKLAWNTDCFLFVAGRYYLGMWFIPIPVNPHIPKGGDITVQCWRFDHKPNEWILTARIRQYKSDDVWDGSDRKKWFVKKLHGTEVEIEKQVAEHNFAIGTYITRSVPVIKSVIFKANSDESLKILKLNPPDWIHMKTSQ